MKDTQKTLLAKPFLHKKEKVTNSLAKEPETIFIYIQSYKKAISQDVSILGNGQSYHRQNLT